MTGGPLTALVADLHARSGRPERAAELLMLLAGDRRMRARWPPRSRCWSGR